MSESLLQTIVDFNFRQIEELQRQVVDIREIVIRLISTTNQQPLNAREQFLATILNTFLNNCYRQIDELNRQNFEIAQMRQPLRQQPLRQQSLRQQPLRQQPLRQQPLRQSSEQTQSSIHPLLNLILPFLQRPNITQFDILLSEEQVIPTPEQISEKTRTTKFYNISEPLNMTCSICQESFEDTSSRDVTMILACKHIFHTQEIMTWFERNSQCPVCRYDILSPT